METRLRITFGNFMETHGNFNQQVVENVNKKSFLGGKLSNKVSSGFLPPYKGGKPGNFLISS